MMSPILLRFTSPVFKLLLISDPIVLGSVLSWHKLAANVKNNKTWDLSAIICVEQANTTDRFNFLPSSGTSVQRSVLVLHHHRFIVIFSRLAYVGLLSSTAVGSQVNEPHVITTFSSSRITWRLYRKSENGSWLTWRYWCLCCSCWRNFYNRMTLLKLIHLLGWGVYY